MNYTAVAHSEGLGNPGTALASTDYEEAEGVSSWCHRLWDPAASW